MPGANSSEFDEQSPYPVIDLLPEQKLVEDKGGTMRLGAQPVHLVKGSKAYEAYGHDTIAQRHRHRYEVNLELREQLEDAGLIVSGTSPDGRLVEVIELADHPFYVAAQSHPEFTPATDPARAAVPRLRACSGDRPPRRGGNRHREQSLTRADHRAGCWGRLT